MTEDRERLVVSGNQGGNAGWFIAGVVVVVLIVLGALYMNGAFTGSGSGDSVQIDVDVPAPPAGDTGGDAGADAGDGAAVEGTVGE